MANITMENYEQREQEVNKDFAKVGYFNSLKNDKDEAIVRFVYADVKEFDLLTAHKVKVGEYYRYISCLRDGNDPVDKCPICQRGDKVTLRFFVKLIEYVKDENGNVLPVAKVWDRPASFAKDLKGYIEEYGDLKNVIFKIKRSGAKGDMQTKYTLVVANPTVYNDNVYVKDFSAFDNFDLGRHSYYDLDFNEVKYFVTTGNIPQRVTEDANNNNTNNNVNRSTGGQQGVQTYAQQPNGVAQAQQQMQYAEQNPYAQPQVGGYQQPQPTQPTPTYQPPFQQPTQQAQFNQYPQGTQQTQQPTQPNQGAYTPGTNQSGRRTYNY